MQSERLPIQLIEPNTGQIAGLPSNPREWTKEDIQQIASSLKETPELFDLRPCIVVPHDGRYILLAGNLRYTGAVANKEKEVPCIIVPEDMPVSKMKEIVIKDNGAFGSWDYDQLANDWDDLPLVDWGVPAWNTDTEMEEPAVLDAEPEEKPFVLKITFPTADKQTQFVMAYKNMLEEEYGCTLSQSGGGL